MTEQNRSSFTGKIGFVLAAAGSAVGLGNIWRFPYLAAKYGGGIFLLVYIILAVSFGFSLMAAEIALGRKTGLSAIGAFRVLDKRFSFVGYLAALVPAIILPYYSVIGGWVTKYLVAFVDGNAMNTTHDDYFTGFISNTAEPLIWFLVFIGITAVVVMCGVEKGVENVSKFMMPILVVLSVVIAIYAMFMPGGTFIGIAFFVMVLFAALTSSISLMETVVSIVCDKFKMKRIPACVAVLVFSVLLGFLSSTGYGLLGNVKLIGMQFLDFFDFVSNSVLMPIVALCTCIFVGFVIKPKAIIEEVETDGVKFKGKKLFSVVIKYIAPIFIVLILISSVLDAFGVFKI